MLLTVLASVAAGAYWLYGKYSAPTYAFRNETGALLCQLSKGEVDAVYDGATPQFRESIRRERFGEVIKAQREVLGEFVEVLAIESSEHFESPRGAVGTSRMQLQFTGGVAPGEFSFMRERGGWNLLGYRVKVPEQLRDKASAHKAKLRAAKSAAPSEVLELVRMIGVSWSKREYDAIYELTAEALQHALTREQFRQELVDREQRMGAFVTVLDMPATEQSRSKNQAAVHAILKFDEVVTTGDFAFIREPAGWRITGFKVQLPGPNVPLELPTKPGSRKSGS